MSKASLEVLISRTSWFPAASELALSRSVFMPFSTGLRAGKCRNALPLQPQLPNAELEAAKGAAASRGGTLSPGSKAELTIVSKRPHCDTEAQEHEQVRLKKNIHPNHIVVGQIQLQNLIVDVLYACEQIAHRARKNDCRAGECDQTEDHCEGEY